ncbi:hypothetical protein [Burkholderia ubonensis]|uniref:DUF2917 domain-containing protein n=1 Tax=Burkholderia ubonensis TaxID=101571 RepID=A0ABD4E0W1_9BURK|nr:hypothetical protein [Burkholderia ubonensis]KVN83467.1 hypothetical protein WJ68_16275 [Burkholderia ubonensis]
MTNHWSFSEDDVLVYRPRRGLSPLAGSVCVVTERYLSIEYEGGGSLELGGGVYQVWFPQSNAALCVLEHELHKLGERRWFH